MTAIVTIVLESDNDDIKMNLDPDDYIKAILERCLDYWLIEDNFDSYRLVKGDEILRNEEKVISSGITKNDVLKLMTIEEIKSNFSEESKSEKKRKMTVSQQIEKSKNWLKKNIGIDKENIELFNKSFDDGFSVYTFSSKIKQDAYLTVKMDGAEVIEYMPSKMKFSLE